MLRGVLGSALLLTMSVIGSYPAFGQGTGSITGTIRDNSGAVIPNATITITETQQGTEFKTISNGNGEYLQAGLPPGVYNLRVTAPGFNAFEVPGIVLRVAERTRVDATMTVGAVQTTVQVEGAATQVQTESAELSGVITGREITQIVLNGRNFTQLLSLTPGVTNQTGQDEGTVGVYGNVSWSVNGGRTEYNNWVVDGGDNMDAGSNDTINVYPSVDAIAETRVLTSDYGAQYGRNGSGTVETVLKSGTKQFHGDIYEFVRNDAFNARNFFATSNPPYKKNDYGYTIGGPVWIPHLYNRSKDKTFFFFSEEWRKERQPTTFDTQVPSNAEREGNFTDVCPAPGSPVDANAFPNCPINPSTGAYFPGNTVPIDPNATAIEPMIPAPTTDNGFNSYFNGTVSTPTNWRQELVRIDENFNDANHFFFHYIHDSWNTITPTSLWSGDSFPTEQTNFVGPGQSLVAHLATSVSPSLLNEFTFSFTEDKIFLTPTGVVHRPSTMSMTGLFDNGFGGKLPGVFIGSPYGNGGGFTADAAGYPWVNSNPTYTYKDQIAKIAGSHNIYAGFYFEAMQKNEDASAETQGFLNFTNTSTVTTGNPWADFLLGRIQDFYQTNVQEKYYYRSKVLEPYVQDDWHVSSRLTLNLGLRISLFGTYPEKYHNFYNFFPSLYNPATAPAIDVTGDITGVAGDLIPGSGNFYDGFAACGTNGTPAGCMKGHLFNPAPRFGFAWDPFGNGRWAIRGGYGIFFEHLNGNEAISGLEGNPPTMLTPNQYNIVGYTSIGGAGLSGTIGTTAYTGQVRWPYVQQWHFDIQHELAQNTVATISYVGSKGTHLSDQIDLNQLQPVPMSENPFHPGQPASATECGTVTNYGLPNVSAVVNGKTVTGLVAQDLSVACGSGPADPYRPYLGYNNITWIEQEANSIYNALQFSLRRTVGRQQFTVAYSYSHSIDDSSDRYDGNFLDSYNLRLTRASSNFDQTHVLTVGYVLELPLLASHKTVISKVLGGWQLSGLTTFYTGTPFSVMVASGNNLFPGPGVGNGVGVSGGFADVVGNPWSAPPQSAVAGILGPVLYNPAAFAAPTGLTFGDAGRNLLRNPDRLNFDVGLFKDFYVTERMHFEFRAEAFNVFNHTEFKSVNNTLSCFTSNNTGCPDSGFLMPNAAYEPRLLQLGLKFIF
jgi:hypothetical protein